MSATYLVSNTQWYVAKSCDDCEHLRPCSEPGYPGGLTEEGRKTYGWCRAAILDRQFREQYGSFRKYHGIERARARCIYFKSIKNKAENEIPE